MARITLMILLLVGGMLWLYSEVIEQPTGTEQPKIALDHSRPKPQGGYYRCPVGEPGTMNPFTGMAAVLREYVLRYTHDALLELDPQTAELRPALAVGVPVIEIHDGEPVYTFTLRDGVRFADGSPLTMADVDYTIRAGQSADLQLGVVASVAAEVESFEAIDDRSFRVRLRSLDYGGLQNFASHLFIVQRKWFEQRVAERSRQRGEATIPELGSATYSERLAEVHTPGPGTGPYRFHDGPAGWRKGVSLTMTQNRHSWRREVSPDSWNLAGIQLRFEPTLATSLVAALNEEVDYLVGNLDYRKLLDEEPRLRERFRLETYEKLNSNLLLVVWNNAREPFDDPNVRRAMTMLFDREAILESIFFGSGHVPRSWFRPGSPNTAPELAPVAFDPAGAKRLLQDAGHPNLRVEVLCAAGVDAFRRPLTLAQDAFRSIGAELVIRTEPWQQIQPKLLAGDFPGGIIVYHTHTPIIDPGTRFHSKHSSTYGAYRNDEVDALLDRARTELDAAARTALLQDMTRIMHRDQPVSLLTYPSVRVLLHRRFQGVSIGPLGLYPEKWWIEEN